MNRLLLVLVVLAAAAPAPSAVAGGSAPGAPVSVLPGFMSEASILAVMGQGATNECFLTSIRPGADFCTYVVLGLTVPMGCLRVDMNSPMSFIEGSDRQGHLSLVTSTTPLHMAELNANMSPTEKTMVQRVGDMVSASAITQGHSVNMLLAARAFKALLNTMTLDNLCTPMFELTALPYGYSFASEGDHVNGTEFGNWRATISNYWFTPWLTPFTAVSRSMETPGLCSADWYKLFCHGGWGTVYPAAGDNPSESQVMNLIDSAYDALNPTYATYLTYGPLHVRMGTELVAPAHSPVSYQFGLTAQNAMLTRGGYIQPLFPVTLPTCLGTDTVANDLNPAMEGWMAQIASKPTAETNSSTATNAPRFTDQGRNIAAALWPRFTCCNYCAGSVEAPERHGQVGRGFWPQLLPTGH